VVAKKTRGFITFAMNVIHLLKIHETLDAAIVNLGIDSVKETRVPKAKLRLVYEFLMVLMRLRLGLLVKDLEYRFKIAW
jgi:hypothetical protein